MSPPLRTKGRNANGLCFERNVKCTRARLRYSVSYTSLGIGWEEKKTKNTPAGRSNILSKPIIESCVCHTPIARITGCVSSYIWYNRSVYIITGFIDLTSWTGHCRGTIFCQAPITRTRHDPGTHQVSCSCEFSSNFGIHTRYDPSKDYVRATCSSRCRFWSIFTFWGLSAFWKLEFKNCYNIKVPPHSSTRVYANIDAFSRDMKVPTSNVEYSNCAPIVTVAAPDLAPCSVRTYLVAIVLGTSMKYDLLPLPCNITNKRQIRLLYLYPSNDRCSALT